MNSLKILFVHSLSILVAKNTTFEPKIFFLITSGSLVEILKEASSEL